MSKLASQIYSAVIGAVVGAGVTAAIFMNQPSEVDQEFARLQDMGFNGGVSEPGLDYIQRERITPDDLAKWLHC